MPSLGWSRATDSRVRDSGEGTGDDHEEEMRRRSPVTCDDCYFRQEGLCALPGNTPCPTFRTASRGLLAPPPQARLVVRPPDPAPIGRAA